MIYWSVIGTLECSVFDSKLFFSSSPGRNKECRFHRARYHLQPGRQNPRARKQERERHRAQPRSQPTSSAASSSASTPSATGATSGTGSSPGTFSSGARTLTATGRLQPDLEVSTPNPPPRASARPRGPLHHGARNPENDRLLEHGVEARRQQKKS